MVSKRIGSRQLGLFCLVIILCLAACNTKENPGAAGDNSNRSKDSLAIREAFESPVTSPEESIRKMKLEDGFEVKLVASEPLVSAPVAMTFDKDGRMWVVEMPGYMPDITWESAGAPRGKIVILDDTNDDGIFDDRKIFLDSLELPRALCLVENGILVAEPPRLWFFEIQNDRPHKKILVDANYVHGENPEGQANGLMRAMDNWIYSAGSGSGKRYRKRGNQWLIERTHVRGQWGISQDDLGRLFYNNNSQNLLGDYFQPGLGAGNSNQKRIAGFNERIVLDNRVYPSKPTPGVNRGYMPGVLDKGLRLLKFTAASGPVVYRGGLFGKRNHSDVFVAEPAANLIKRNILKNEGYVVSGKQAYEGREFLTSEDERFRPVSLYNGPDGALYIVDMYRGVIQWKGFLTDYLKNEIRDRSLDQPLTHGRIYKVIPKGKSSKVVKIPDSPDQLVDLLRHSNGWVRDRSQQMLVDRNFLKIIPDLERLLNQADNAVTVSHALWTLEGLGALDARHLMPLLRHSDWRIRGQALSVLLSVMNQGNYRQFLPILKAVLNQPDSLTAPYLGFIVKIIRPLDSVAAKEILLSVVTKNPQNIYVADAAISSVEGQERALQTQMIGLNPNSDWAINKQLKRTIADIEDMRNNRDERMLEAMFPRGARLYKSTCVSCHGPEGDGVAFLAPPLNQSEWVTGEKTTLIKIVLFGLSGPVTVNGKLYQGGEVSGDMPGIGSDQVVVDEDIAQLLSFIRNSWSNEADRVTSDEVASVRRNFHGRQNPFTADELRRAAH